MSVPLSFHFQKEPVADINATSMLLRLLIFVGTTLWLVSLPSAGFHPEGIIFEGGGGI